ncbi:MAG: ABC transporter ATP-binding protein/permease [Myxococcales bacterium]|nr:ABC transporter ATP-binding protein/permease [Myxococcales bacterium]
MSQPARDPSRQAVAHAGAAGADLSVLEVLRRTTRLLQPHRRDVLIALGLIIAFTGAALAGPFIIKVAIDEGIEAGSVTHLNFAIGAYVLVKLSAYVLHRYQIRVLSRVGESFLRDLRVRVFAHLQRLSMPFYDRQKAGVLVSRMTSDVDSLQELVQTGLMMLISNGLLFLLSAMVLTAVSWQLMLSCLVAVPFVLLASVKFARDSRTTYTLVRDRIANTLSQLQEGITGVRVIQAYAGEAHTRDRFAQANHDLFGAHMAATRLQAWYLPVIEFAGTGTTALVVGVGGFLVHQGSATIGTVTFFILTLSNLFEPIQQFSQLFNQVQSASASLRKLYGLLDTEVDVPEREDSCELPERGPIEVQGLSFSYHPDGPRILEGVDLSIAPGERLALVGPTGAGKSTLAKLIARLYDPTAGQITFGGVGLRDASAASLRKRIVVVPQEGFLFNASIRDNVRVARGDASDIEVEAALARIGVLERFAALPQGLDTQVDERGARLSAGEKQLVSLARAALVDPAVLILDEATSSLDPGTEALVDSAMQELMQGRTVIVIAHRLGTAEQADRVGVVAGGHLAELGSHDELVALGGHYASLYDNWQAGLSATAGAAAEA